MWEPPAELPQVEAAAFGNAVIVRYPHEDRFEEIKDLIRTYADKPDKDDIKIVQKSFIPPAGYSAKEVAVWLKLNHPEFEVDLEDIGPKTDETYGIEQLRPLVESSKVNPCVLPGALAALFEPIVAGSLGQTPPDEKQENPSQQ